jgi:hypothetical protein
MTGPFAAVAHDLRKRGLAVVPCPAGKSPAGGYSFGRWKRPPGERFVAAMIARHGEANAAVVTGLSPRKVTVVDVDDPGERLQLEMIRRCGESPLATMTPSGGLHLWYAFNRERSTNLRDSEAIPVEVKSAASKLLVVVPPSFNRETGAQYFLAQGSWDDLDRLPPIKRGAVPMLDDRQPTGAKVRHRVRNDTLLRLLLRQVRACDSEADLLDVANTIVDQHFELHGVPPFPRSEVQKIVASVWKIQQEGRNWAGQEAKLMTTASEFRVLQRNPDAYVLWMTLRWMHSAREEPFAVVCRAMAEAELIDGWTYPRRYMHAKDWLLEQGFLVKEYVGGSKRGDPHLYRLVSPVPAGKRDDAKG